MLELVLWCPSHLYLVANSQQLEDVEKNGMGSAIVQLPLCAISQFPLLLSHMNWAVDGKCREAVNRSCGLFSCSGSCDPSTVINQSCAWELSVCTCNKSCDHSKFSCDLSIGSKSYKCEISLKAPTPSLDYPCLLTIRCVFFWRTLPTQYIDNKSNAFLRSVVCKCLWYWLCHKAAHRIIVWLADNIWSVVILVVSER